MKTIFVLAAAILTLAPSALATVPTVGDVVGAAEEVESGLVEAAQVAHVQITSDLKGAEIGGTVRIEGKAWVEQGFEIGAIRFYVDHVFVGSGDRSGTWAYELDTRRFLDGPHEFTVEAVAAPVEGDVWVLGFGATDSIQFQTLNHVVGVVLHEETYEGAAAWRSLWSGTLDRDYVGLQVTVTTEPASGGKPLVGEAVLGHHEPGTVTPAKTWVATFGVLQSGGITIISRPPDDLLKAGSTLALAGGFVGDGKVTIRIVAVPWS